MSRLCPFAFGLLMGLTAFAGWSETLFAHSPQSESRSHLSSASSQPAYSSDSHRISILPSAPETAFYQTDAEIGESLTYRLLITDESAQSQAYQSELTHQRWMRFAHLAVAPFSNSRSLPLLR